MCDCRKELTEDRDGLIAAFIAKRHKGAAAVKIDFDGVAFPLVRSEGGSLKMRCVTTSNLKVMVAEKKRPVEVPIMHSFCPFCGVKYEGDAADPEEVMA